MMWRLDEDAAALLHTMTGDENPEHATPVTLFVGESCDDDGKPVYGLHAYESEYPEEGCTPLVEFDPPPDAVGMSRASRAMLLNVLWHHQGGSSPVGQPLRKLLGIAQHDHLTDEQLSEAKWIDKLLADAVRQTPDGVAPSHGETLPSHTPAPDSVKEQNND